MADDTHRYDGTKLYRTNDDGDRILVENGQTLTPTDAELKAFGDSFTEIRDPSRDDATDDESESADETGEAESQAEEEGQDQSESETSLTDDQEALTDHLDDPSDYGQVRSLAASTDGVKGNASQEEMTAQLAEKARDGDL